LAISPNPANNFLDCPHLQRTPDDWQMSWDPSYFARLLIDWFALHGRHNLPWQVNPTPYRVWVSEVMLQQTQVTTVLPYFERFLSSFPDVESLASSSLDEVLHVWTGLGYYARARNMRVCAQAIVANHGGEFPLELQSLVALPGIGRTTAGAILALSSGQRQPILDGNVRRVLARVFGIAGNPSSSSFIAALWAQSEICTPTFSVSQYTQAIMDFGATVCTRSRPACTICPVKAGCVAALEGRQAELPGRKEKRRRPSREATLLIAQTEYRGSTAVLVERRPPVGLWGGLWSPPQFKSERLALDWCQQEIGEALSQSQRLPPINHAFTHFDLRIIPVAIRCQPNAKICDSLERRWYRLDAPPRIGLPQPIRQLFERLHASRVA
jgi:A/G-specific adenine glycosylase